MHLVPEGKKNWDEIHCPRVAMQETAIACVAILREKENNSNLQALA
jgi:hypothetical protein